jgi:predicted dehydrogenase
VYSKQKVFVNNSIIRIGFIGAGANTRLRHLPGFAAIPGAKLQVVNNRSEASSRAVADTFGIQRIAGSWRDVVEADDVDAICIGTWPYLHAEISIAALNAGKHVLTEARMAMNVAEAEAMLAASKAHPALVAQIVPAPMSLDMDATIIELLKAGGIGQLRETCITHTTGVYAKADTPISWRQDVALSGVNTLTLGIYYEMLARWIADDPQRVLASRSIFTSQRTTIDGEVKNVTVPDSITILGEYQNDARLLAHFSGVEAGMGRDEIRLNGSAGCLRVDFKTNNVYYTPVGDNEKMLEIPASQRRGWRVEADFIDSIRSGAPVRMTSFDDGLRYMKFTEAVLSSRGGWVYLMGG